MGYSYTHICLMFTYDSIALSHCVWDVMYLPVCEIPSDCLHWPSGILWATSLPTSVCGWHLLGCPCSRPVCLVFRPAKINRLPATYERAPKQLVWCGMKSTWSCNDKYIQLPRADAFGTTFQFMAQNGGDALWVGNALLF